MPVFRIEVRQREPIAPVATTAGSENAVGKRARTSALVESRIYLIAGALARADIETITRALLCDPVSEEAEVVGDGEAPSNDPASFEVHLKPGVMDPVAETLLDELTAEGYAVESVRTARRFRISEALAAGEIEAVARGIANDCIEDVYFAPPPIAPPPKPPERSCELQTVEIRSLGDDRLVDLSRSRHLFLSLEEMQAIRRHFQSLGREPTDLELETIAQTWSEHCVHKTLKSAVRYEGDAIPSPHANAPSDAPASGASAAVYEFDNLLKDTIARATRELIAAGRGPECLSVFEDNAGVIAFDERYGVAFKVETHNHPSAIEPYGGAATGIGGCIRDVLGCGLGARPIANTDVFCVAPGDWPTDAVPRGALHPARVLDGVVRGVADYGNRMGIPTVNGAVLFHPRYLGNPLVFCGCAGLLPRDRIQKAARPGDRIVLLGGRTGRDGIHGATFSSAELSDGHADEFSHAVQIGNAITEKRCLDAVLAARNDAGECLYDAITDCGAGGFSSAVGEMGAETGAVVDLETVPLKYPGLRYDEIWISEAQERMVLAVPPEHLEAFLGVARDEEVEATVIGAFGETDPQTGAPRLTVRYAGRIVGRLDMRFLHEGVPRTRRAANWRARSRDSVTTARSVPCDNDEALADALRRAIAAPDTASKEWIVRRYDHEVQGGSVVKPLCGFGAGPADAAVVRPRFDSRRGIALGCGLRPSLSAIDPYWMALASIDEAVRNVVCVGGDPRRTALLDNFCWGRCDDPERMGALVRACRACYDGAMAYGTPFISGKDSLNNEFALAAGDVDRVCDTLGRMDMPADELEDLQREVRATGRIRIPDTLLISAVGIVEDIRRCVTADLKDDAPGVMLVGGLPEVGFDLAEACAIHAAVADAIAAGWVRACHDVSDGGWLTSLAEMALGGGCGVEVVADENERRSALEPQCAGYVLAVRDCVAAGGFFQRRGTSARPIGRLQSAPSLRIGDASIDIDELREIWRGRHPARST